MHVFITPLTMFCSVAGSTLDSNVSQSSELRILQQIKRKWKFDLELVTFTNVMSMTLVRRVLTCETKQDQQCSCKQMYYKFYNCGNLSRCDCLIHDVCCRGLMCFVFAIVAFWDWHSSDVTHSLHSP